MFKVITDGERVRVIGRPNYGSIGHLPESRLGPGDHKINPGQARIATEKTRDKRDVVIVQEKLDGSNVGVYMDTERRLHVLTRAGYYVDTSPYPQHWVFGEWVRRNAEKFLKVLLPGERLVGEWLYQAHGTRYEICCEDRLFVAFDLVLGTERRSFFEFARTVNGVFATPPVLHVGGALPVEEALDRLGLFGHYGSTTGAEGVIYRVERRDGKLLVSNKVDFLAKYVNSGKVDGCYLDREIYNYIYREI